MMDMVGSRRTTFAATRTVLGWPAPAIRIARGTGPEPDLVLRRAGLGPDVSIQAQVLNLLKSLQGELGLTYVFVAHNMGVVEHISDRVAVMYLGRFAEVADRHASFADPQHPYTQALMSAIPIPDPALRRTRVILAGDVPSPLNPPSGCRFHPRCPLRAQLGQPEVCATEQPELRGDKRPWAGEHLTACHFASSGPAPAPVGGDVPTDA
jgi:oligopeptide/dipeptide ABC transporter ATP-binding protein